MKHTRALAAALLVGETVGCTGHPSSPSDPNQAPQSPGTSLSQWAAPTSGTAAPQPQATQQLPLQQYMLIGRNWSTVNQAWTVLVNKCMADQGFSYHLKPTVLQAADDDLAYRRYGVDSLEIAQQYGYRDQTLTPEAVASKAAEDQKNAPTPAETQALTGGKHLTPTERFHGGCMGEADQALSEGTTTIAGAGLSLSPIVRTVNLDPRATESPETTRTTKLFAQCMADAGYPDVKTPATYPPRS